MVLVVRLELTLSVGCGGFVSFGFSSLMQDFFCFLSHLGCIPSCPTAAPEPALLRAGWGV